MEITMADPLWNRGPHHQGLDRSKPVKLKGDPSSVGQIVDGIYDGGDPTESRALDSYTIHYTIKRSSDGQHYTARDINVENAS